MVVLKLPPSRQFTTMTNICIFLTLTLTCDLVTCLPFLHGPLSTHDGIRLEKVANDLSDRLTRLTIRLQSQSVHMTDLATQIAKLTGFVSFTVTFASREVQGLGQLQTLKFDKVLFNAGNGYDPETGFFTAPKPGLYAFDIGVTRHAKDPESCLQVDLVHSSKEQFPSVVSRHTRQSSTLLSSQQQQQFHSVGMKQQQQEKQQQAQQRQQEQQQQNSSAMLFQQQSFFDDLQQQSPSGISAQQQQQKQQSSSGKQQQQQSFSDSQNQQPKSSSNSYQQLQESFSIFPSRQQQVCTTSACSYGDRSGSNRAVLYLAQGDTVHARMRSGTMLMGDIYTSMSGVKLS